MKYSLSPPNEYHDETMLVPLSYGKMLLQCDKIKPIDVIVYSCYRTCKQNEIPLF